MFAFKFAVRVEGLIRCRQCSWRLRSGLGAAFPRGLLPAGGRMEVHPTRVRRLRARKAVGNAALAAALLAVGTLYLVLEKNVTLVVDGQPVAVRTLSSNVGQLLDASGIVLQGRDSVVP